MKALLAAVLSLVSCGKAQPVPMAAAAPQENPKEGATAKWKVDAKLSLIHKDKEWVFILEGTSNIPKQVSLRARVYAVEIVNDPFQGKREDEEPLVWEDEDGQTAYKVVDVKEGKFKEEVYHFKRQPWSILYRGRLHYRPRDQSEDVVLAFGDDEWSAYGDLRVGTDADYAEELKTRLQDATDDLTVLLKLYNEFRKEFNAQSKKFDAQAWKDWKAPWSSRVEGIEDRNKLRFSLWAIWMERQAKMRVNGLCDILRRLVRNSEEQWEAPKPDFTHVQEMLEGWYNYFEDSIENIGIDAPLDAERVGPLVKDYETAFARIRAGIQKGEAADPQRREARRDCLAALLKLPPLLQNRKRAYKYVNDLTVRFTQLLEAAEAEASPGKARAVQSALEEHDQALQEFKKFGGLR